MSGKVKNQHYVPKMYLKRFTSDNGRFCVWNLKKDNITSRQRPENYATKRYYYDTSDIELKKALSELLEMFPNAESFIDYNDEQFIEKALSRMESKASKTLEVITKDTESLYDEDNARTIIIFLHILAYRSEKYRFVLENIEKQFRNHIEELGVDSKQIDDINQSAKDAQLFQMIGFSPLLETATKLTEHYDWYIGTVSGQAKLVVSDNPAQGIMLGFNDICIPLSGEKAIVFRIKDAGAPLASKDMPVGNEIKLSERSVLVYNSIQLSYANRFIFGDKNSLIALRGLQRISSKMHQKNDKQRVI